MQYSKEKKYTKDLKYNLKKVRERNINKNTQNIYLFISLTILLFSLYITYIIFFSDKNYKNLVEKEKTLKILKEKEIKLLEEKKRLEAEIQNLKNNNFYTEKLARENLGLIKKDEKIFIIPEEEKKEKKETGKNERWIDRVMKKIGLKN